MTYLAGCRASGSSGESGSALHSIDVHRVHLSKSSSSSQNFSGGNGTIHYVSWDTQDEINNDFSHSTTENNSRIGFNFDGRVSIKSSVGVQQGGSARTTLAIYGRLNGSTVIKRAKHRNYSRGANYGDISLLWDTEVVVEDGDYIEIAVVVDDTDSSSYTRNTFYDECELIVTRI